jgi:hypothetical protein
VYRRAPDRADVRTPLAYLTPRGADSARLAHRGPVRPGAIRAPANVQSSRSIGHRTRGVYPRAPNRATARTGLAFPRAALREACTKPRPAGHSGRSTTHRRSRLRLGRTMERWPTTDSTSSFATGGPARPAAPTGYAHPPNRGARLPRLGDVGASNPLAVPDNPLGLDPRRAVLRSYLARLKLKRDESLPTDARRGTGDGRQLPRLGSTR